jgi:hypothetical protein
MANRFYASANPETFVMSPEVERAQSRLQQSERSFSQTQQELHNAIRERASTPMSAAEFSENNNLITYLQQKLRDTETEMSALKTTIERQKATIKNQSDALQNPKPHFATPSFNRFGSGQFGPPGLAHPPPPQPIFSNEPSTRTPPNQFGPGRPSTVPHQQQRTSSPFSGPRSQQQPPRFPYGQPPQPQPPAFRPTRGGNEYGSPEAMTQAFGGMAISKTPGDLSRGSLQTPSHGSSGHQTGSSEKKAYQGMPPPGYRKPATLPTTPGMQASGATNNGMALVRVPSATPPLPLATAPPEVAKMFGEVMSMSQMYAFNHVNTASTHHDNAMPQSCKQLLLNAASTTSAFLLMQTPFTRYFLVNKVILQFIIRTILKHDTFAGFDVQADQKIESCRNQIYQSECEWKLLIKLSN